MGLDLVREPGSARAKDTSYPVTGRDPAPAAGGCQVNVSASDAVGRAAADVTGPGPAANASRSENGPPVCSGRSDEVRSYSAPTRTR